MGYYSRPEQGSKMETTVQEKFDAAVKVIHSLPQDGPFQPSYEMMKKFYGYYKQSTEGRCNKSKPGFWDLYNRTKWEAWNKLGEMSKEEAMTHYVEELKKMCVAGSMAEYPLELAGTGDMFSEQNRRVIHCEKLLSQTISYFSEKVQGMDEKGINGIVEAMPQDENVAKFTETLGSFYEIIDDDLPVLSMKTAAYQSNNPPIDYRPESDMEHNLRELTNGPSTDTFNHLTALENVLGESVDEADAIPYTEEYDRMLRTSENEAAERDDTQELDDISNDSTSPGHVTDDSDTEEEFCDTSQLPSQESMENTESEKSNSTVQNVSTPLKPEKLGYRFHFDLESMITTVADVHENTSCPSSPIATPLRGRQVDHISFSPCFPFEHSRVNDKTSSDSLLVHGPTVESLNASLSSQLEERHEHINSTILTDSDGSITEYVKSHGGGENFTPRDTGGGGNELQDQDAPRGLRRGVGRGSGREQFLQQRGGGGHGRDPNDPSQPGRHCDVNEQISLVLFRLQQDMTNVLTRITDLEVTAKEKKIQERKEKDSVWPSWCPFHSLTGKTVIFVLVWPFIVHWILKFLASKRKRPC